MAKTALTHEIEKCLYQYTKADKPGVYGAYEVCFGPGYGKEYVDYMTMTSGEVFRCYEIKITMNDLKSSNKLTFKGNYNYLVVTKSLYDAISIATIVPRLTDVGILIYDETYETFTMEKRAKNRSLSVSQKTENMHCMVRSLSKLNWR